MASTDLVTIERQARVRYEWARLRRALTGFAPVLVVAAVAAALARHPSATAGFGVATFVTGVILLWYGRDYRRAVLPGVAAGLFPLVFAVCASHWHHCSGDGCVMLCVPACVTGGIVAGLVVGVIARRQQAGAVFLLPASGLAVLTGAMGCACVGYAGIAGLGAGYAIGLVSALVRRALQGTARR